MTTLSYTPSHTMSGVSMASSSSSGSSQFAFAKINGDVCLVQLTNHSPSPLMVSDVRVFHHELITIFRYSHSTTLHPSDIHVLEVLDERCATYQEDNDTVFLPRDVMDRMQKLSAGSSRHTMMMMHHQHLYRRQQPQGVRHSRMARIH